MRKEYKLLHTVFGYPIGTIVYEFTGDDEGLTSQQSRATGEYHVSITKSVDGYHPFFIVPAYYLEEI
jgi:hypothetical protein